MRQKFTLLTRMMLLLCVFMVGAGTAWAEEETIASFTASESNHGEWTINGNPEYGTSGGGFYKLISSDVSIETPSINWSGYETITITISARKFGGPDATQGKISVSQGKNELASYSPSGTTIAASSALSISPTDGIITISCPGASSSKGCGVQSIVIKGTAKASTSPLASIALSGDYPTSFFVNDAFSHEGMTVTATYEDNTTKNVTSTAQFSGYDMAIVSSSQTVTVSYTEGEVTKTASYQIEVKAVPTHEITWSVNGTTSSESYQEGASITFPANPADIEGKTFVGWVTDVITGTTDEAPTFVTSATMGNADVTYYAVFATVEEAANTLNKMQAGDTFAAGDKIVVVASTDNGLLGLYQETISNSYVKNYTFVENYSNIVADDKNWWTVSSGSNGGWILGDATNGYLYTSGSNNLSVDKTSSSVWTLEDNDDNTFSLKSGRYLSCRTDLTGDNTNRFRMAGSTPAGVYSFTIYKLSGGSFYSGYCTTVAADTRAEAGISFAEATVTKEIVENYTGQALTNPNNVSPITWTSSNEAVATVDNGTVTVIAVGETTISAAFAGDENYKKATVSYTLTVQDSRVDPGFSFSASTAEALLGETFDAPTFSNPNNVAVTFESTDETVATIAQDGTVTILAAGTTTIKATSEANNTYLADEASYTLTVTDPNAPGTENNPYTVAEAIAATPASGTTGNVYISGIVSSFKGSDIMDDGTNYRYYISDDGTTATQLLVYKGKGLNQEAFTSADDLKVGDEVVICGKLTTFSNAPEIASGNYLVSWNRPADTTPSITLSTNTIEAPVEGVATATTIEVTYSNISNVLAEVYFCDAEGEAATYDWVNATINADNNIEYTISANTGAARTAYMKVYALDDEANDVYSELITINQAKFTIDYATLPFEYDGNGTGTLPNGMKQSGLGTYTTSPKMKFDGTGDELVLKVNEAPRTIAFDVKGNPGQTGWEGTFKVQTSVDGSTYNDLATYTDLGDIESVILYNGNGNVRYIKWTYTKVQGNVALGNIKVTNTIKKHISNAGYATLFVPCALDFTGSGLTAYIATVSGNKVSFSPVTTVPANTGVLLKGDEGDKFITVVAESTTDVDANKFEGVITPTEKAAGIFVLMNGDDGVGFYKTKNAFTVGAHTAYLPATVGAADARTFIGFDDEGTTTAINRIAAEKMVNGEVYNLQGQRVAQPTKGLYIVNGKKVVMK